MTDTAITIRPALTPEEWRTTMLRHDGKMVCGKVRGSVVLSLPDEHLPAAAALALYGQPFGFTHADVQNLRAMAQECEFATPHVSPDAIVRHIADRLAALLPPETP